MNEAAQDSSVTVRPVVLVPTYNNPDTLREVVKRAREHIPDVIVVDDGSSDPAKSIADKLASEGLAHLHRRSENGGKGAAVKDGLATASELGYTHALQVDADLQHELADIPKFLEIAQEKPDALVLASPVFDDSAPWIRLMARKITRFWVHVQTGGRVITDPMCGFRLYPLARALAVRVRGNAMDFDPEIAVRMQWDGTPIVNLPTRVRYNEGGVSHFRQIRDNGLLTWMHIRLTTAAILYHLPRRFFRWVFGRKKSSTESADVH